MRENIKHCFEPIFDENSRVLILGTMPSPASRANGFYYSHPQNRFWKVLGVLFREEPPKTVQEKKEFLLRNKIAVWDVLESCDIIGASDASIKNAVPNDIGIILKTAKIEKIIANGSKAYTLYNKFQEPICGIKALPLPSTSPANAKAKLEQLVEEYGKVMRFML